MKSHRLFKAVSALFVAAMLAFTMMDSASAFGLIKIGGGTRTSGTITIPAITAVAQAYTQGGIMSRDAIKVTNGQTLYLTGGASTSSFFSTPTYEWSIVSGRDIFTRSSINTGNRDISFPLYGSRTMLLHGDEKWTFRLTAKNGSYSDTDDVDVYLVW